MNMMEECGKKNVCCKNNQCFFLVIDDEDDCGSDLEEFIDYENIEESFM